MKHRRQYASLVFSSKWMPGEISQLLRPQTRLGCLNGVQRLRRKTEVRASSHSQVPLSMPSIVAVSEFRGWEIEALTHLCRHFFDGKRFARFMLVERLTTLDYGSSRRPAVKAHRLRKSYDVQT